MTPLPSFGWVTSLHGAPGILGRLITEVRYWSGSRTRLFARKLRRVGLTLMRRVDTFISVNLPPNQPVASLFCITPMKTTLRSTLVAMIFSTMLLSSGCEEKTVATDPAAQSTPGSTKPLEAADLVGYDGKRLRKSVDRIKEGNEKHNQELEKMAGSGPDQ